jgi:hypothetical protein
VILPPVARIRARKVGPEEGVWQSSTVLTDYPSLLAVTDVKITYKPLAGSTPSQSFDDLVEYRKQTAAPGTAPSTGEQMTLNDVASPRMLKPNDVSLLDSQRHRQA